MWNGSERKEWLAPISSSLACQLLRWLCPRQTLFVGLCGTKTSLPSHLRLNETLWTLWRDTLQWHEYYQTVTRTTPHINRGPHWQRDDYDKLSLRLVCNLAAQIPPQHSPPDSLWDAWDQINQITDSWPLCEFLSPAPPPGTPSGASILAPLAGWTGGATCQPSPSRQDLCGTR